MYVLELFIAFFNESRNKGMAGTQYLTKEGLAQLCAKLDQLRDVERPAIVQAIAEAREKGDLSENAEYHAAKEAQAQLEEKIAELEATVANARVIDPSTLDTSTVKIHCKVRLMNHTAGVEEEYTIVSSSEADFKQRKISTETPIAKALLGKKEGDRVTITVPKGDLEMEILSISIP